MNIPIQSKRGLSISSWNHLTLVLFANPFSILFKLNNQYFESSLNQNGKIYDFNLAHYVVSISSSKQNISGFNGFIGPLTCESFTIQSNDKKEKNNNLKERYLNILIDHNIEQNTKFVTNIQQTNDKYGYAHHHSLCNKQHSLITLQQLLEHECSDTLNVSSVPLKYCQWEGMFIDDVAKAYKTKKIRPLSPPRRNLLLVCHDMAGNYHHDAYACGHHIYNNKAQQLPFEYFIEYWQFIDIFVYFSHDFITIPPVSWIECAHKHQTLILGTLITEHEYGTRLTHQIIDNADIRRQVVDKLVAMAVFYGFDGWLLNFESHLNDDCNVNNLILFVKELSIALHKKLCYAKVIWYDSVSSKSGKVQWQSRLNDVNLPFFRVCDGIFTDYHWQKKHPLESLKYAKAENEREYAVFTGIDIWGRGTYGDGQYNTGNIVNYLLNEMCTGSDKSTSIALFGTAWTFEHECSVSNELRRNLDADYCNDYDVELFRMNEARFWRNIRYFMYECNEIDQYKVSAFGNNGWQIDKENNVWIASFNWCTRQIVIDLNKIFDLSIEQKYKILIKQSVIGSGPKYEDLYHLMIDFKDINGGILHKIDCGQMIMSNEWRHLLFEYDVLPNKKISNIVITERAKDIEYWAGHYGTKVKYPIIMILCDENNAKNNDVSIVKAIKYKNNEQFDTFLYIDKNDELFWCNTFCLGFGKNFHSPSLHELGILDKCALSGHSWFDLSMADWNQSIDLKSDNAHFPLSEDEELMKALRMSMMEETECKEDIFNDTQWRVSSCFEDAFIGGHCLKFQAANVDNKDADDSIFQYTLHRIAQNKFIESGSLLSISFAIKQKFKGLFYLSIEYVDDSDICHAIKCKDELNKNGLLNVCGHSTKQCFDDWMLHTFDFKMGKDEKIKLTKISANILCKTKTKRSLNDCLFLGYISICIESLDKRKKDSMQVADDEKLQQNAIVISHTPTVTKQGALDNIVRFDWSNCKKSDFEMINLYLVTMKSAINDRLHNKWMNAMTMKQALADKQIQNVEWILSTKFEKRHILINSSVILSMMEIYKDGARKHCLLFEMTKLKYDKAYSGMWCAVKLQN